MKQLSQRTGSRGIGLIDVLIALVVVAVGVLAIANLQGSLFSSSGDVKARNEALELARERIEEFRSIVTLDPAAANSDPDAFNTLLALPATACATFVPGDTNAGWRADGELTGVNAAFNRWVCVTNSTTLNNAREITMAVSWVNMQDEAEAVTLNTLVAFSDPGSTLEMEAPTEEGGLTPSPNISGMEGKRDDSDFDPDAFEDELDPEGDGDGLERIPQEVGDNLWTRYTSDGMRELVRLNNDNEYEVVLTSYGGTIQKIQGVSEYQVGGTRKEVWNQSYVTAPSSANNYRPMYTCDPGSNVLCSLRVQATTPGYCVYPDVYHEIRDPVTNLQTHFGTEDMKCAVGDNHCAIYTCYVPGDCTRTSGTDDELAALDCPTNAEISHLKEFLKVTFGQDHANGGWYGRVGMILAQEDTELTTNQGAVICVDSGQGLTEQRPSRYYVTSRVNPKDSSSVTDPANLCGISYTTNVNVCVDNQNNEIVCPSMNPVFKERRLCDEGIAYQIAAHEGSNTPVQCHNFMLASSSNQDTCNIVAAAADRYLRGAHAVRPLFDSEPNTVLPTNTEFCHRFEIAGTGVMHVIGDIESTGWRGTQTGLNVNIDGQTCLTDLGTRFTLADEAGVADFMGQPAKRYTFNYLCRKGVISWTGRLAVELDAISLNFGEAICDQNVFNGVNLTSQRDNPYEYNFPNVVCNYQEAGFDTTRTVTVDAGEGGTVELVPESGTVEQGEAVSIIFTPDAGNEYGVTTNCNGEHLGHTYTIAALNNNCTMTVSFWDPDDVVFYTVSATTTTSGGTIDPASRDEVAAGQSTTFTVTPESGYIASVSSGCGGSLAGEIYTTGAVNADCAVEASFTLLP